MVSPVTGLQLTAPSVAETAPAPIFSISAEPVRRFPSSLADPLRTTSGKPAACGADPWFGLVKPTLGLAPATVTATPHAAQHTPIATTNHQCAMPRNRLCPLLPPLSIHTARSSNSPSRTTSLRLMILASSNQRSELLAAPYTVYPPKSNSRSPPRSYPGFPISGA